MVPTARGLRAPLPGWHPHQMPVAEVGGEELKRQLAAHLQILKRVALSLP